MSFGNTLLSKFGLGEGGMSSLLPLHISPPQHPSEEHDLSELSPRPDDALLSPGFERDIPYDNDSFHTANDFGPDHPLKMDTSTRSKSKGKAIAFAYQGRPQYSRSQTPNSVDDDNISARGSQRGLQVPPGIWRPNIRTEQRDNNHAHTNNQPSFVESILMGRPDRPSDRTLRAEVDNTFRMIQRRERQMQKELQRLLDAQGAALERDLAGDDTGKGPPSSIERGATPDSTSSTVQSKISGGSVVPVRQPKRKPMSKRQARIGIARSVTMLADLKNEEDAYIAGALAERKTALSRLRNYSSQRKSIAAEMKALEEDNELPIKTEIAAMEDQHRIACASIDRLEEKLRVLRRAKSELERKLGEARSTRDSSLSGYRGALKQCDQGIAELMKFPGIQVLEVEELKEQGGEDVVALMSKHVSGREFLSLRPERRTMEMVKDWWEGEVAILEQRKAAVDKERAALEEGSEIWQHVLAQLTEFENGLNEALRAVTQQQRDHVSGNPEEVLRNQYNGLRNILRELQEQYEYVESRGWNLLIAAIGAEIAHFLGLKEFLADVIRSSGYDDGVLTPRTAGGNDLVDVRENGVTDAGLRTQESEEDDGELSRSVVRRWDDTGLEQPQRQQTQYQDHSSPPPDLLGENSSEHREENDNEVPPGLLSEVLPHHNESEDEHHNDVPVEFLSMHSPTLNRDVRLRRESSENESANEVPPDLLAESRRDEDGVD
ncbi:uncharacterized protein F4822DRAFT_418044 [Hypoxylon trugodes]|uniref:uncharacterized protein n=1 Tax=Hypoxylon trugodes TaxID=326681 RepID=UPI00218EC217|nr:uncharacterized protein F4822DRAFT_418044 [Hypoxylon trugodes]KAI1383927.1 hypothetical protein F4822DRAFT_418044 [Hypoxylon trugodes]